MIGHDDVFVQFGMREMPGDFVPERVGGAAEVVEAHDAVHDVAEQRAAFIGAQGDVIVPGRGIITRAEARAAASVKAHVEGHAGKINGNAERRV